MPRPKNHAAPVTAAVEELLRAVTALVGSVHGAVDRARSNRTA